MAGGRRHGEHIAQGLGLFIGTDEQPLARPNRAPAIGAQFKPFPALLLLGIHQMPQIQLALATVLGAELDVLLPARVLHPQLVVGRGAQHVAVVVARAQGHVVGVFAVVQGVGDVGAVRVALFEGHRHFGAGDQRQVQAVGVAGVGPGQAQPHAFLAGFPGVAVEQEVAPCSGLRGRFRRRGRWLRGLVTRAGTVPAICGLAGSGGRKHTLSE